MNVNYQFLFKRVEIGGANSLAGYGAVGFPSLTAFLGLSQEWARALAGESSGRFLRRFAIVHHTGRPRMYGKYQDKFTQKRYFYADAAVPSKAEHWLSPPEEIRPQMDLTVSLLLEVRISAMRAAYLEQHPEQLHKVAGGRALGGVVQSCGKVVAGSDALALLRQAGRGYAIVDHTSALFPEQGEADPLDLLLDRLASAYDPESGEIFFMSHIGYLGISPEALRTQARGATLHVHGEPVFGLASFRRTFALAAEDFIFWTPVLDRESQTYTLKGEKP
ncbi:type I-F CRISPR-associated protein Csy2 [Candidatus Magnetaquicoccus inordinatus]|uniref:type I-F CRISPR-associated protein Csy2 n=1 Tax=Candidatus Magnetaquicoccus inordinatus TaxID=2496818 RepID=UPI00187D3917|nr:type I-F CRISPR-associated protein Csy2 [Candidatus Magnetaquicoccus inordinatus]